MIFGVLQPEMLFLFGLKGMFGELQFSGSVYREVSMCVLPHGREVWEGDP